MKNYLLTLAILAAGVFPVSAHGGGSGPGMGGGGMGGSGMLVVADDGSVLVTEMNIADGMMGGGAGDISKELINIDPSGTERWRASFDEGWPMMPSTDGDLVILTLADDLWMGAGGWGGNHKTLDEGHEGGAVLIGLALSTGQELWQLEIDGMMAMPEFTEDGSRFYLTVRDMDRDPMGTDPLHQGDAAGGGMMGSSTLMAVDRNGNVLWTVDLGDGGMMDPIADGGV